MTVVDSGGCAIRYATDGPAGAPALLLCNSLGTDLRLWQPQLPHLASDHRVVRFDLRGHGGSDAPPGDYRIDQLGGDALAVLDDAGIGSATVVGVSLGGLLGLWLAVNAADRVERLVAANTAARVGTAEAWQQRIELVRSGGMAAVRTIVAERFFSDRFRAEQPEDVEGMLAILDDTSPDGYAGCCAALRDADLRGDVEGITAPTLVIGGGRDLATPPEQAEELAALVPGATLEVLDAGHLSNVEMPEAFTAAVRAWLAG